MDAQLRFLEGIAQQQQGRVSEAIDAWRAALEQNPHHADAHYNLAVGLAATGDMAGAERTYMDLLSYCPDHRHALYNLANLKMRLGDAAAAEPLYRHLLAGEPRFIGAWINLALARSTRGDLVEAESCLRSALALEPEHVGARWNLAILLLSSRRWQEAWREYEWRLRRPECPPPPGGAREWMRSDAQARRILLWNDQGIGDALQFARYIPHLAARGHEVWLFVQDSLKTLLQSVPGVTGVAGASDPPPPVDAQAPLLSLPHRLGMPDPKASWQGAYVRQRGRMALPRRPGRRAVGVVWASNPAHPNRALRDVPLAQLKPVFDIEGIDWFSLQVGAAVEDIAAAGLTGRVHDLSPRIRDFADTAAAVAALDLVISVDTSVPHLVGAMARPGWVMISAAREWRWAGQEPETPWYPSLRLFRQTCAGDWSPVVSGIAAALQASQQQPNFGVAATRPKERDN